VQVHHGLDGDLGAGDGEPFADGVGGEGLVVVLEAGEVEAELPGVGVDLGGVPGPSFPRRAASLRWRWRTTWRVRVGGLDARSSLALVAARPPESVSSVAVRPPESVSSVAARPPGLAGEVSRSRVRSPRLR
jgi:hypothetical protein